MEVGFDFGGLDAEDEAEFAEKQLLCHFPVAKLRRADAAAQRREALLLLIEGFAEAEQTLAIMLTGRITARPSTGESLVPPRSSRVRR